MPPNEDAQGSPTSAKGGNNESGFNLGGSGVNARLGEKNRERGKETPTTGKERQEVPKGTWRGETRKRGIERKKKREEVKDLGPAPQE